jgi:phage N-6-adenine-methyltransferase
MNAGMFSSDRDDWATPQALFDRLNRVYGFELDVCATPFNAKCQRYYTREDDGLAQDWAPWRCWLNPPYGRTIGTWLAKAYTESQKGAFVVALVPARTDTGWWWDWASRGEVRFLRGRLRFGDGKGSAPFPSALITYAEWNTGPGPL